MPKAVQQSTTRRALLSAAPAIAAIAVPAVALAAAPSAAQASMTEDVELARLAGEWSRLDAEHRTIRAEIERIREQAERLPAPEALYHRPGKDRLWYSISSDFSPPADAWAVGEWRKALQRDECWWERHGRSDLVERAGEILSAWDRHQEAKAQLREQLGEARLEERDLQIARHMEALERRAMVLRATTREGWAFKARLYQRYAGPRDADDYDDMLFASLMRDLQPVEHAS